MKRVIFAIIILTVLYSCKEGDSYYGVSYIYGFLISEKEENLYKFAEQYYTFFASIKTDKNELFKDSCIVKRFKL